MRHISRQEMVGKLVELLDPLDMSANYSFFLLKDPDIAVYFHIAKLVIVKILECGWDLVLAFVVEKDVKSACVVVNFKLSTHRLLDATQKSAADNDVGYRVSFELTDVIRSRKCIHNHPDGNGCEHFRFFLLGIAHGSVLHSSLLIVSLSWVEEPFGSGV
jgi:hypothetical protein